MDKIDFNSIPLDGTHEFTFGKHKDDAIEDIPSHYLAWVCENVSDQALVKACQVELAYRDKFNCHIGEDDEYISGISS